MNLLHYISSNPKKLFLIDSLGALLTTFNLAVVLPYFESLFYMPHKILYLLALIAGVYTSYSIVNYLKFGRFWRLCLKIIAFANLFYCLLTIGLVIWLFPQLLIWDLIYFSLEVAIIIFLVTIELQTARKSVAMVRHT